MSHLQTQWQPPVPSLASLPVDRTKTEPKPAFYKLQFGDDITGFSYYVRTLTVMIGRNCDAKGGILPPPDERNLGGPTIPPLESGGMEDVLMEDVKPRIMEIDGGEFGSTSLGLEDGGEMEEHNDLNGTALEEGDAVSAGPVDHLEGLNLVQGEDGVATPIPNVTADIPGLNDGLAETEAKSAVSPRAVSPAQPDGAVPAVSTVFAEMKEHSPASKEAVRPRSSSEDQVEVKVEEALFEASAPSAQEAVSLPEDTIAPVSGIVAPSPEAPPVETAPGNVAPEPEGGMIEEEGTAQGDSVPLPPNELDPLTASFTLETSPGLDPAALEALALAATSDSPPPPPPPPIRAASGSLEHVDVDLGPLKSVSRNHAKINYLTDLGHFCLEIYGRNGAWVDDRYFVRGSIVPLNQGSQIQIATRIFHFILPPSPDGSPYGTPYESYALEELPYPYNLPAQDVGYQEFYGEGLAGPGPSSAAALATRFPEQYNVFTAPDGHGLGLAMDSHGWLNDWSDGSGASGSDDFDDDSDEDDSDDDSSEDEDDEEDEEEAEEVVKEPPKPIPKIRIKVKRPPKPESDLSSVSSGGEEEGTTTATGKAASTAKSKAATKKTTSPPKPPATAATTAEPTDSSADKPPPPPKSKKALAAIKGAKTKAAAAAAAAAAALAVKDEVMEVDSTAPPPAEEVKERAPMTLQEHLEAEQAEQAKTQDKSNTDKEKPKVKQEKAKTTPAKKESKKKAKAAAIAPAPPATPAGPSVPTAPTLAAATADDKAPLAPTPTAPIAPPAPTLAAIEAATPTAPPVRPIPPPSAPPAQSQPQPQPPVPTTAPVRPPPPTASTPTTPQVARPPVPVRPPLTTTPSSSQTGTPEPTKPFVLTELIETPGRPGHILVNVPIPPSGAGPRPPPGPLIGLDAQPFIGPPPLKPTATFATIIHRALLFLPRGRGTLGEVCNWVAGEWEWFRLNIDAGWQNSIRHNLSLNKAFLKVPRIPEDDPESKGSVWIIDPKEGPKFEEKQRKDALKAEGKGKNSDVRREKERIRVEERQKKLREMPHDQQSHHPHPHAHPHPHPHAHPHAHAHPSQGYQQRPLPANHPHAQARPIAATVRPTPRPVSTQSTTGISKGLPAKGKIAVTITPITAALRQKSVIATTDQTGKALPFTCDGSTLSLDQQTFGHLTADILEKLTVLGPAQAVEVISAWVINKNKQMAAASAGKAGAGAGAGGAGRPPAARPNGVGQAVRPGAAGNAVRPPAARPVAGGAVRPGQAPTANMNQARPPAANPAAASASSATPASTTATTTSATATTTQATAPAATISATSSTAAAPTPAPTANAKGKVFGPAPPGATLTRVIGMIAEVANAKGDVNIVGPNASALLRYIRVVGVDIDLKVADRIWATGVLPPLPMKKAQPVNGKPGGLKPPAPGTAAPVKTGTPAAGGQAIVGGVKRKLESPTPTPAASSAGAGAGAAKPTPTPEPGGSEVKKPKLETAGA